MKTRGNRHSLHKKKLLKLLRGHGSVSRQFMRISPLSIGLIVVFALIMTPIILNSYAAIGPANVYTSPGGMQSVTVGNNITITIRISTAGNVGVNGGSIYLTYPANKLSFQNTDYSAINPYQNVIQDTLTAGIIRIDNTVSSPIAGGDHLFASITFKALAAGPATVNFNSTNSYVKSADDASNLPLQLTGTIYTINAPPTPVSTSPISTPGTGDTIASPDPTSLSASSNSATNEAQTPSSTTSPATPNLAPPASPSMLSAEPQPQTATPTTPIVAATTTPPVAVVTSKPKSSGTISTAATMGIPVGMILLVAGGLLLRQVVLRRSRSSFQYASANSPIVRTMDNHAPLITPTLATPTEHKVTPTQDKKNRTPIKSTDHELSLEDRLNQLQSYHPEPGSVIAPQDPRSDKH